METSCFPNNDAGRADGPNAKFIDHEEVVAWLATWGTPKERAWPR
jgi:predicted transcriptional regulator